MVTYADTSFLVSLYLPQPESTQLAEKAIKKAPLPVILSPLTILEMRNAFNLAIRRGEISGQDHLKIQTIFQRQIRSGFYQSHPYDVEAWYASAGVLSDRYTPKMGARSLDLLHVAAALMARADYFLTFDQRQREVAEGEGLRVW